MRRLHTALQRYAWGKVGSDSTVAQLKKAEDSSFDVDESAPYAELWMGTHPNGPSRVARGGHDETEELYGLYGSPQDPGMFLIELLETHPHYLGEQEDIGDLPFMFKVLSINKALSIQAHPDKERARKLCATRPDLYKDENHKPEMAVALSEFEGLCGFRSFQEILANLKSYPELRAMVGAEATAKALSCTSGRREHEEDALRALFRAFVTANVDVVAVQVSTLVTRVKSGISSHSTAATGRNGSCCSDALCGGKDESSHSGEDHHCCNSHSEEHHFEDCSRAGRNRSRPGSRHNCTTEIEPRGADGTSDILRDDRHLHAEGNGNYSDRENGGTGVKRCNFEAGCGLEKHFVHNEQQSVTNDRDMTCRGLPAGAVRRRGWSSSSLPLGNLHSARRMREDLAVRKLIVRLAAEYPGDIGIMMPLLLNYLRMGEGESFFMAANEPHAYLKGNILEVMARSDNVVRVALTPKHRDVPLLCELLTYHMGAPPIVQPIMVDDICARYTPPIKDFEMLSIQVPRYKQYTIESLPVAALAIVLGGSGFARDGTGRQNLGKGVSFFIPARTAVEFHSRETEHLWVCLARSNLNGGKKG